MIFLIFVFKQPESLNRLYISSSNFDKSGNFNLLKTVNLKDLFLHYIIKLILFFSLEETDERSGSKRFFL